MSDTTTGTRPDPDELASAYLDGELDATQRAAVEADPTLLARVEELAVARAAVAGPVAVAPPEVQAAALAAALDVHDQLWAARPVPVPEKQSWWHRLTARRLGPALAGAALVAVAAVGVVAAIDDGGSSGGGSDVAAPAPDTTVAAAATGAAGAATPEATSPATLSAMAAPAPDLGSVDDEDLQPLLRELPAAPKAVVAEVEAAEAGDTAATGGAAPDDTAAAADAGGGAAPSPEATSAAGTAAPADTAAPDTTAEAAAPPPPATYPPVQARTSGSVCPAPEGTVFYGTLDVDGADAEVFVGTSRAVALAVDGCTVLAEVPLP